MEITEKDLWEGIILFDFIEDDPLFPMLKELMKEALKLLFWVF